MKAKNKPNKFRLKREAMCLKLLKSGISETDTTFFGNVLDRIGSHDLDKFFWLVTKGIKNDLIGDGDLNREDMDLAEEYTNLENWKEREQMIEKLIKDVK